MTKTVLVNDPDATPVQQYAPIETLTGAQTDTRTIYVGDEDPAVDHLADLIEGDLWIDTSFGWPFQNKIRNDVDDWSIADLVLKDGSGNIIAQVRVDAGDGTVALMGGPLDNGLPISSAYINGPDGSINLVIATSGAGPGATLSMNAAGVINGSLATSMELPDVITIWSLPTADPVSAGRLWNDAGTLKVSAG